MQHFAQALFFLAIPTLQGMASLPRNPCKIFLGQIKRSLAREVVVAVLMDLGVPYPDKAIRMVTCVFFDILILISILVCLKALS